MTKLTNIEADDLLYAANEMLRHPDHFATAEARDAIATAKGALTAIRIGLVTITEKRASEAPKSPD